jgi:hypothetical protein
MPCIAGRLFLEKKRFIKNTGAEIVFLGHPGPVLGPFPEIGLEVVDRHGSKQVTIRAPTPLDPPSAGIAGVVPLLRRGGRQTDGGGSSIQHKTGWGNGLDSSPPPGFSKRSTQLACLLTPAKPRPDGSGAERVIRVWIHPLRSTRSKNPAGPDRLAGYEIWTSNKY